MNMKKKKKTDRFQKYQQNFLKTITSTETFNLVKLYSEVCWFTYNWMKLNNIEIINLPISTQSISSPMGLGSDSLPYKVNSEKEPEFSFFLADSMQFYLELLLRVENINRVGYISPSFRGENVDERHLHQFNHFEIEIKGDREEAKSIAISYLKKLVKQILYSKPDILSFYGKNNIKRLKEWLEKEVKNLDFSESIKILRQEFPSGIDDTNEIININSYGEKFLIKKFSNNIIWVNNFPWMNTPFYQKRNGNYSLSSDLLIGVGETVGLGERCINYDETISSILEHKNDPNEYNWYLEMKRLHPMKTSGFGIGLERLILFLTGLDDIRETQIIPRITNKEILP